MKKFTFLPFVFICFFAFGQKQIVVQGDTLGSFASLQEAVAAAHAGDTIYIPGGGFSYSGTIDKTLHWCGVGHYPDSTAATGKTVITSSLTFDGNCDSSSFEGIEFSGSLAFGSNDNEAVGIRVKRCRVKGSLYFRSTNDISAGRPDLDVRVSECVLGSVDARNGMNCRLEKNLIFGALSNFYRGYLGHNTVNMRSTYLFYSCQFCQIVDNVFAYNYGLNNCSNCTFVSNVFQGGLPYDPVTSTFSGSGNITDVGWSNMYVSIVGNVYNFSYDNDYHLNSASTGKDENGTAGVSIVGTATDGTNAGVYGTAFPYKEGAVPAQPHVRTVDIAHQAVDGQLDVKITVAAQDR